MGTITDVTPEQTAASSKVAVRFLGRRSPSCPKTLRRARELGLTGWAFFVAGLGAALGDVPVEMVVGLDRLHRARRRPGRLGRRPRTCPISEIAAPQSGPVPTVGGREARRFRSDLPARRVGRAGGAIASTRPRCRCSPRGGAVYRRAGRARGAAEAAAGAQAAVLCTCSATTGRRPTWSPCGRPG